MKKNSVFFVLSFMHKAMMVGQLIFLGVLFYLVYSKTLLPPLVEQEKILQAAAIVFTSISLFAGISIFKKKLALIKLNPLTGAKKNFTIYRQASLLQWSLTEVPVLVCGICYFMTGKIAFLALAALPFLFFVTQAPVKNKVIMELEISEEDLDEL